MSKGEKVKKSGKNECAKEKESRHCESSQGSMQSPRDTELEEEGPWEEVL